MRRVPFVMLLLALTAACGTSATTIGSGGRGQGGADTGGARASGGAAAGGTGAGGAATGGTVAAAGAGGLGGAATGSKGGAGGTSFADCAAGLNCTASASCGFDCMGNTGAGVGFAGSALICSCLQGAYSCRVMYESSPGTVLPDCPAGLSPGTSCQGRRCGVCRLPSGQQATTCFCGSDATWVCA